MKLALILALAIVSVNVFAQRADPSTVPEFGASTNNLNLKELLEFLQRQKELLDAQTNALQALSDKLGSLEERISKIEEGPR